MNLARNPFLGGLKAGQPQVGLWMSLASAYAADVAAGAEFDWALIDMEHTPNDLNSVLAQLQVYAGHKTTPIVRPQWNDTVLVKRLLDIGAPGLLFPMIQSAEEASRAVAACRYPPSGVRGVSGTNRANNFGRVTDYFDRVEAETAVLVQLETRHALGQADAIAQVDGVDGVFFGPADIAADMGLLGQPANPAVWEAIRPVARRLIDQGMPVGTLVFDEDLAKSLFSDGFSFVACGSDVGLLARGSDALMARMRNG